MKYTLTLLFISIHIILSSQEISIPKDYKLIVKEGFSGNNSLKLFEFNQPDLWLISKDGNLGKALKFKSAQNSSGILRPTEIGLLKEYNWKDFIIEFDVFNNGKDFTHRDFSILWGVSDTSNYCFANLSSLKNTSNHNIFKYINGKAQPFGIKNTEGINWGFNQWHHVLIVRNTNDKSVQVYFNNHLVLQATEESPMEGKIGFGTIGDGAKIDNLKIWAPEAIPSNNLLLNQAQ